MLWREHDFFLVGRTDAIRMNPRLHEKVVLPTVLRLLGQGSAFDELDLLREIQRDPERLESVTRERLVRLLDVASGVPFYSESARRMDQEADPLERLAAFPILRKTDLQERPEQLRNPSGGRGSRKTTGGSTGEPVTVIKSSVGVARERAATWLGYGWFDVGIGDRGVRFWGSPRSPGRRIRYLLADVAMNRKRVSAFAFRRADLQEYWQVCVRFRPAYLYGYASMLEEFARFILDEGLPGRALDLKVAVSTAEPLTAPRRSVLHEALGAPVQNEYGCGEVGPVAYECPEGLLHVMSQNVVVEVIREDGGAAGPGESGDIVVTDLNNHAAPLIRYALGDRATVSDPCGCGLAFPTLSAVWGRTYDFIEDAQGRRYHGEAVMYVFEDLRDRGLEVGRFQVRQLEPGQVEVRVVPGPSGRPDRLVEAIERSFAERLGGMRSRVSFVDSIARAPSGKHRLIVAATGSARPEAPRSGGPPRG